MKRPFKDKRPIGPFYQQEDQSPLTIADIREQVGNRDYNSLGWCNKTPKRLYHTTDVEGLVKITQNRELRNPDERFNETFLSAAPGEQLGSFSFIFDGQEMVDKGYSPRTFLRPRKDTPSENIVKTHIGDVVILTRNGCYPDCLWEKYQYPGEHNKCGSAAYVYSILIEEFELEPYGSAEIASEPVKMNMGNVMQQTFTLMQPEPVDIPDPIAIIYEDYKKFEDFHNSEPAIEAANELGTEAITLEEATERYPEITSPEPAYNVY